MISTFDLSLMGGLISFGGLLFFLLGTRRRAAAGLGASVKGMRESESLHDSRQRAEFLAGMRWLTVGALVLFVGLTRGTAAGYLFDLWTDIAFHVGILSACWAATAYRVKHVGGRPAPRSSSPLPANPASNGLNTAG